MIPGFEEDRRLVAFAAVFVPASAAPLFARLVSSSEAPLGDAASQLAGAARSVRLAALGAALADLAPGGSAKEDVERLAAAERPRIAAAVRDPRAGRGAPTPAFRRLLRERLAAAAG